MNLPAGLFKTILIDPPWRFSNRSGKIAPEHKRLARYATMSTEQIARIPIWKVSHPQSHLYLWAPAAFVLDAGRVMAEWGYDYKTQIIWEKIAADGQPDGRCCGFYFRVCTEFLLFGTRGNLRTRPPFNVKNVIRSRKREHSRKPEEAYQLIERASFGPFLELFARGRRQGWTSHGDQLGE